MSVEAWAWALKRKTGSQGRKLVLLCLANYASKNGLCWPAQSSIAKQTEQSIDTLQRRLDELEEAGFLTRVERPAQNGKKGGKYLYQLQMKAETPTINDEEDDLEAPETTPQAAARSGPTTPQLALDHTANEAEPHRTPAVLTVTLEPSRLEPSKNSGLAPVDDWPDDFFELFWSKYPPGRKTSKKEVRLKLEKIRKSGDHKKRPVSFVKIMLAVRSYAHSGIKPEFTKAPEVWLNKECWEGETPVSSSPAATGDEEFSMFDIASGAHRRTT